MEKPPIVGPGPHEAGQERYRELFEQAAVGVALIRTDTGRFLRVNRKYTEILGRSENELLELDFMQLTLPEDLSEDLAAMERLKRGELREFSLEKRLLRSDGSSIWVALTVSPMWAPGETPTSHIAIVQDISARRLAEQRSADIRAELDSTLAALPDLLFDVDDEGRIYDFRAPSLELLAVPPGAFLGRRLQEVLPPDAVEIIHKAIAETCATGSSSGSRYKLAIHGAERWFEVSISRKTIESERPRMVAIARDITERIEADERRLALELQLRQAQKMEAVGTLAGGVAHDFNNLLAVIDLGLESGLSDLSPDHPARESFQAVQVASARAAKLVQQILAFSRQQPTRRVELSANAALTEATTMLRSLLPASIRLVVTTGPDSLRVKADPTHLHQILLNLGTNAWQAIDGTGTVTFGVREATRETPTSGPESYALFSVTDDGVGMSPATRERIFEPFFTTRGAGQGTGLGLSVVHGIVQEHEGSITVESGVGLGTTFSIFLRTTKPTALVDAPPTPMRAGQGAMVFYVDDEPTLVHAIVRLLKRLGYRARGFTSAGAALQAVRENPESCDLMMTDLTMPEMSGIDLARAVTSIRPAVRVVLVSGHAPLADEHLAANGIQLRLAKPFDAATLSQTLAELLGSEAQPPEKARP